MPAPRKRRHADGEPLSDDQLPQRINVAVSPDMLSAIDLVIERENVTLTEAVRRLVSYGDFVYRAVKVDDSRLFIHREESMAEVVLH